MLLRKLVVEFLQKAVYILGMTYLSAFEAGDSMTRTGDCKLVLGFLFINENPGGSHKYFSDNTRNIREQGAGCSSNEQ